MKCEDCDREARWLVVTRGVEWISRFCSEHVRTPAWNSEVYERTAA